MDHRLLLLWDLFTLIYVGVVILLGISNRKLMRINRDLLAKLKSTEEECKTRENNAVKAGAQMMLVALKENRLIPPSVGVEIECVGGQGKIKPDGFAVMDRDGGWKQ